MKLIIESTPDLHVIVEGPVEVPARLWVGHTESGTPVQVLVTRIAVANTERQEEFERELQEHRAPRPPLLAFPLRMIL